MPVVPLSSGLSSNEHYPGIEEFHARVRAAVAEQDRALSKARARGRHDKKFPKKRDYSWPTADAVDTREDSDDNYYLAVGRHLASYALHCLYLDEDKPLTLERMQSERGWLHERVLEHMWSEGQDYIYFRQEARWDSDWAIAWEDAEGIAYSAADFALDAYRPIKRQLSEWGRKGGQRSTRGKTFTLPVIDGLERMSKKDQVQAVMDATGCSESTAWRRLRELSSKPPTQIKN